MELVTLQIALSVGLLVGQLVATVSERSFPEVWQDREVSRPRAR